MNTFFSDYNNLALIATAAISGGLLAWPALSRSGMGNATSSEVTQLINRRNALVIDVRDTAEYAAGHVPQSRNVPLAEVEAKAAGLSSDKSVPVVVVCQTGMRSRQACRALAKAGYAEVVNLTGGVEAWKQAGLPLAKKGGK